jgi:hypothetical protein
VEVSLGSGARWYRHLIYQVLNNHFCKK